MAIICNHGLFSTVIMLGVLKSPVSGSLWLMLNPIQRHCPQNCTDFKNKEFISPVPIK